MARRTQRPRRAAGRKPKEAATEPAGKASAGRGRPAVFTREDILEAAKAAFSKAGYANVTLDDLAAQLNTGKGTLYYHSNRKVDLLIAISTTAVGENAVELRRIALLEAPPQQRLALAMRVLMHGIIGDRQASKVYFENEADLPPKFRATFRRRLRDVQDAFVSIVGDGVAAGVFRGDPSIVSKHILSVCAWPYRWFSPYGTLSLDAFIDSAVRFVLGGVMANPQVDQIIEAALASSTGRAAPASPTSRRTRAEA